MLILLDLDGTLINTVHPTWKPYKDGLENCSIEPYLAQIPVFPGAREFIASRKTKGDSIIVVSDSHFRHVNDTWGRDYSKISDGVKAAGLPVPSVKSHSGGTLVERMIKRHLAAMQKKGVLIREDNTSAGRWVLLLKN